MKIERWRPILGYEDKYLISDAGQVLSLARVVREKTGKIRIRKERVLRNILASNGYLFVILSNNGKTNTHLLHRLVVTAFIGASQLEVNHKDGDKTNNDVDNLEYVTHSQNIRHSYQVLKRKPVCSWKDKTGFEHNKSVSITITNTITGKVMVYGSLRQAAIAGFNRATLSKCLYSTKLYHKIYKVEKYE